MEGLIEGLMVYSGSFSGPVVFDTGNPWILLGLSISIPAKIHTHGPWVWILTGIAQGTATGTKSTDMGITFYTRRDTMKISTTLLWTSHHPTKPHHFLHQAKMPPHSGHHF